MRIDTDGLQYLDVRNQFVRRNESFAVGNVYDAYKTVMHIALGDGAVRDEMR